MNRKFILPITMVLLAGTALAAKPGVESADTDGDGAVTLAEFENAQLARAREHFSRLDADGDGLLSADEMKRPERGKRDRKGPDSKQVLQRLDADGSGGVSLAEFDGARFSPDVDAFSAVDADGNGELNADELRALKKSHRDSQTRRPQ